MADEKKSECKNVFYWTNYKLSAWLSEGKDGKPWFKYQLEHKVFLGKDKPEGEQYKNQSLSLNKIDDLCYLKTLVKYLIPRQNPSQLEKNCYIAHKILNEEKKLKWKDKDKPTKEEMKMSLNLTRFVKSYTDENGKTQQTKNDLIINTSELDILRDFIDFCISKIYWIKRNWQNSFEKRDKTYKDNVDYSQNSNKDEFIDENIDDEIPF